MAYENRSQTKTGMGGARVVSREAPDMATDNRGQVLPESMSVTAVGGRRGRRAYNEPADFMPGPNGDVGVGSMADETGMDGA